MRFGKLPDVSTDWTSSRPPTTDPDEFVTDVDVDGSHASRAGPKVPLKAGATRRR